MAPLLKLASILAFFFLPTLQTNSAPQTDDDTTMSVAIVGAGITGASAAYHLLHPHRKINITIFESSLQVGGHLQSQSYISHYTTEKGAPHFSENDACLVDAVDSLNLRKDMHTYDTIPVALWDWSGNGNGSEFLLGGQGLRCSVGVETGTLQDLTKIGRRSYFPPDIMGVIIARAMEDLKSWMRRFQRYGILAPWKLRRAVAGDLAKWKHFAQGYHFSNLKDEISRIGLSGRALGSAKEYVDVTESFEKSQIEPCTRDAFAQNLDQLRGFGIAMSGDPGKKISLQDGNARLVEMMLQKSGAVVKTNSRVIEIKPGTHRRYQVRTANNEKGTFEFDKVIIASIPENLSSMLSNTIHPHGIPPQPQYTEAHVTYFATQRPLRLPRADGNDSISSAAVLYFTNNPDQNHNFPNLFQASTSYAPEMDCHEAESDELVSDCDIIIHHRVHRIVSGHELSDLDIAKLVGVTLGKGETLESKEITRVERTAWPRAFPVYQKDRAISGDIELAPGLLYLGGGEEVIASLEMGCRMGRNAAGLVVIRDRKTERIREEL